MRITVEADTEMADHLSAYSEYSVFASIGQFATDVEWVVIRFTTDQPDSSQSRTRCELVTRLASGRTLRCRATAAHPAAALEHAAEDLRSALFADESGKARSPGPRSSARTKSVSLRHARRRRASS